MYALSLKRCTSIFHSQRPKPPKLSLKQTQKETFVYDGLSQTNPLENQLATTTLYDAFFLSVYMLIQNQPHLFFTFKPFAEQPQRRCLSKSYD
jgi:hypothetical protein